MMNSTAAPIRFFAPQDPAPCLRLQLHDQSQVVFPYYLMGETTLDPSAQLLICHFGSTVVQIEGQQLLELLIGLQYHRCESIQAGTFAKDPHPPNNPHNPLVIQRICLVQVREVE
jgi:hypothetical protein